MAIVGIGFDDPRRLLKRLHHSRPFAFEINDEISCTRKPQHTVRVTLWSTSRARSHSVYCREIRAAFEWKKISPALKIKIFAS